MSILKTLYLFLISALSITALTGQNPVKWQFEIKPAPNNEQVITLTAIIEAGWNTYSQTLPSDDGPVATSIKFEPGDHFSLVGKTEESGKIFTAYDEIFAMQLTKIKEQGVFKQRILVKDATKPIKGTIEFMVCNNEICLPPKTIEFSLMAAPFSN
jgi:hypothetical protein